MYWGYWARNNLDVKKFRIYGAHHVINDDTVLLATRALRNKGKSKLEKWPGVEFERGTEEHLALIGTYAFLPSLSLSWILCVLDVGSRLRPRSTAAISKLHVVV